MAPAGARRGGGAGGAGGAGGGTGGDPFSVAPKCTSGTMWTGANRGSADMNPGRACITCHSTMNGPSLTIAGTVYPTAHEPDLCNGANGSNGARVVITGADGADADADAGHVRQFQLPNRREDAVQGEGHVHGPRARDGRDADVGRLQQLPHADRREQRAGPNPPAVSA